MSKWSGVIGFVETEKTSEDVWEEKIVEKKYRGELYRNTRRFKSSDSINDNIDISNEISIISDHYIKNNFAYIRYVSFMGVKWLVNDAVMEYPRIKLTIGGVYNGKQATSE